MLGRTRVVEYELALHDVEDRVVVAAPQLDCDLTGDDRRDPALERLAQHHRLRVEPAALVEQASEPPSVLGVALERRLVVGGGEQAFVRDVEEREPRCFVDPAALGLDDAVLDLVGHAEPVPASDLVRATDDIHRVADRRPFLEANRHDFRLDLDGRIPEADAHDRLDDRHARFEQLS